MPPQTLTLTITISKCHDEHGGVFHLKDTGTTALVSDTETEEQIGSIGACIGGGLEIALNANHAAWFVSYQDIWEAFENALEEAEANNG
ncbi:MAG: hypothetical protein H6661_03145 [Ardenticatenaceae bacterium]|nr:hypothetical protein [Ardenticatenaceae bacterium]